mmetsp:Transcript_24246/g.67893  ORF Transcript_24246/g.67893 Transcript_24246/m.67893 type:complete len:224 (-) Transcript_24246:1336-2007(-)
MLRSMLLRTRRLRRSPTSQILRSCWEFRPQRMPRERQPVRRCCQKRRGTTALLPDTNPGAVMNSRRRWRGRMRAGRPELRRSRRPRAWERRRSQRPGRRKPLGRCTREAGVAVLCGALDSTPTDRSTRSSRWSCGAGRTKRSSQRYPLMRTTTRSCRKGSSRSPVKLKKKCIPCLRRLSERTTERKLVVLCPTSRTRATRRSVAPSSARRSRRRSCAACLWRT